MTRICKNCRHRYVDHDCLTSNPVKWRCSRSGLSGPCRCTRYEDLLIGKTEVSGQLASLLCRLGMWCAQEKNKSFTASTDEVEAWLIDVGKAGVSIQEALEDFLIVKLYSEGSLSSRVKDIVKPHRGIFQKEIELFVDRYRVLLAEHVLVS